MARPGQDRMLAAAEIIRREARRLAEPWSVQIPPEMQTYANDTVAEISSKVGPSYPNEVRGVRHPVFGNREVWVTNEYRPFLAPAAESKAEAVAREIAKTIDDIGAAIGFRVT